MQRIKSPLDYRVYTSLAIDRSKSNRIDWTEMKKYAVEITKLVLIIVMVLGVFSMLFITRPPEKSNGKEENQTWEAQ